MAERFASVSEDELCEKCIIKQLLNSVFACRVCRVCVMSCLYYLPQASALADNTDLGFDKFMISCSTSSNNCLL